MAINSGKITFLIILITIACTAAPHWYCNFEAYCNDWILEDPWIVEDAGKTVSVDASGNPKGKYLIVKPDDELSEILDSSDYMNQYVEKSCLSFKTFSSGGVKLEIVSVYFGFMHINQYENRIQSLTLPETKSWKTWNLDMPSLTKSDWIRLKVTFTNFNQFLALDELKFDIGQCPEVTTTTILPSTTKTTTLKVTTKPAIPSTTTHPTNPTTLKPTTKLAILSTHPTDATTIKQTTIQPTTERPTTRPQLTTVEETTTIKATTHENPTTNAMQTTIKLTSKEEHSTTNGLPVSTEKLTTQKEDSTTTEKLMTNSNTAEAITSTVKVTADITSTKKSITRSSTEDRITSESSKTRGSTPESTIKVKQTTETATTSRGNTTALPDMTSPSSDMTSTHKIARTTTDHLQANKTDSSSSQTSGSQTSDSQTSDADSTNSEESSTETSFSEDFTISPTFVRPTETNTTSDGVIGNEVDPELSKAGIDAKYWYVIAASLTLVSIVAAVVGMHYYKKQRILAMEFRNSICMDSNEDYTFEHTDKQVLAKRDNNPSSNAFVC